MKIYEIVNRALADPAFAIELAVAARQASAKQPGSPEFERLAYHFADTPEELAALRSATRQGGAQAMSPTTLTTSVTTVTTLGCTFTTTTTTTTTGV